MSSQTTGYPVPPPHLGIPAATVLPPQFNHTLPISATGLPVGRLPMTAQTIPGQVKLESVSQIAQHPGMFPQAYIISNGHPGQEFVQAQQVAGQVVGTAPQVVPPPPPVDGAIGPQMAMQNGQPVVMVDPNSVPGTVSGSAQTTSSTTTAQIDQTNATTQRNRPSVIQTSDHLTVHV